MSSSYKLRSCVWEITLACCFSCEYCGSGGGRRRENELSAEECLDVTEQLAALGCHRVSLIGGEVFLRPDWEEIVGTLTASGIQTSIITNGFLFSEELISVLENLGVESVAVSLDGPEHIHDVCRQAGSYQRAANAIQALTKFLYEKSFSCFCHYHAARWECPISGGTVPFAGKLAHRCMAASGVFPHG